MFLASFFSSRKQFGCRLGAVALECGWGSLEVHLFAGPGSGRCTPNRGGVDLLLFVVFAICAVRAGGLTPGFLSQASLGVVLGRSVFRDHLRTLLTP